LQKSSVFSVLGALKIAEKYFRFFERSSEAVLGLNFEDE